MTKAPILVTVSLLVFLTGCSATGPKESAGGLFGAAAGGLIGSQIGGGSGKIAAAVIGALAGAALGGHIGREMDATDRAYQRRATNAALESNYEGRGLPWQNADSGHSGSVTPTRTWQREDGTYCREFTQVVNVGGRQERAFGTACRQVDGTWKIMS